VLKAISPTFWSRVFRFKGAWNCILGVAFLVGDDAVRDRLGVPRPDPVYRAMFLALAFSFGIGYWRVGGCLAENTEVVRIGVFGQLAVFGVLFYAVTIMPNRLPWPFLLPGIVDLVFAVLFILFLVARAGQAETGAVSDRDGG
jgi:hypothetical protein